MIKTTNELELELNNYANYLTKISRLVRDKKLYKIKQGLYETDININPFYLTNIIYGPSYISFQTALAYYGMIPERVHVITSATSNKHRSKKYKNEFGTYLYKDVPVSAYPYGIERVVENGYCYFIASKEKALCDMLYEYKPVFSMKDMEELLFDDLRIDQDIFNKLDMKKLVELAGLYKTTNHKLLINYLRRKYNA